MILTDERSVVEEVRTVFGKLDEMKASLARMNTELAERTDYESESYAELIDRISNLSDLVQMEESENGRRNLKRRCLVWDLSALILTEIHRNSVADGACV